MSNSKFLKLHRSQLEEPPVDRLSRLIRQSWWDNLTRQMGVNGIEAAAKDPKMTETCPRIYVPPKASKQYTYYSRVAQDHPKMSLDVQWLPDDEITAEFIKSINQRPGTLALAMGSHADSETANIEALPFIVPGGRFNELYYWDTCFCALGMLGSHDHVVKSMIRHFVFEIEHYGKVLNANRSYYLGRSQPPFLTWLALKTFEVTQDKELLREAMLAAIKEYNSYWTSEPRLDRESGLSRYRPIGAGSPPECPLGDFAHILSSYATKHGMTVEELGDAYNRGTVIEPALDDFFNHDRAVRESGHDTSNRVEGVAADLATVDLNCLLYKYEVDIAHAISAVFEDRLPVPAAFCSPGQEAGHIESSGLWRKRAETRKALIDKYLWNDQKGLYFDYNTVTKRQSDFESATGLWPLWCGAASEQRAAKLVANGLQVFECPGGLSSGSEHSRGPISAVNPQKQWDFPYGWAPHQILAWDGLLTYGYPAEAERLAYRWLHMITRVFVNFNGTVVEKYNVTRLDYPHRVDAEYGNQGLGFRYVPREG